MVLGPPCRASASLARRLCRLVPFLRGSAGESCARGGLPPSCTHSRIACRLADMAAGRRRHLHTVFFGAGRAPQRMAVGARRPSSSSARSCWHAARHGCAFLWQGLGLGRVCLPCPCQPPRLSGCLCSFSAELPHDAVPARASGCLAGWRSCGAAGRPAWWQCRTAGSLCMNEEER